MGLHHGQADFITYGKPSLLLDFAREKSLVDRITRNNPITFERASIGTYVDENGLVKTAAADGARFDHDPVTGESLGLLIEEQRTNLVADSTNYAGWSTYSSTVSKNTTEILAPDGTYTAVKVTSTGDQAQFGFFEDVSYTADTYYTHSVWLKAGIVTRVGLTPNSGGRWTNSPYLMVDLSAGTILGTSDSISSKLTPYSNGWYLLQVTGLKNGTSETDGMWTYTSTTGGHTGDTTSYYYVWGGQIEAGEFPTSYIPTSGSTVTRQPDSASVVNSDIYNTDTFTITNEPFGASAGSSTLSLIGPNINIKKTAVYSSNLPQASINSLVRKTDDFWRWRILGSSFGLPSFTTDGQVTVDWGDGTVETLTTSDHTFSNGVGYHEIGFRLDSGTYFRPQINNNSNHDTKLVAVGPAPESMKVDLTSIFYGASNLVSIDSTISLPSASNQKLRESICTDCSSLKSFPYIDFSGASSSSIRYAWKNCTSMESFPLLDLSQATNLGDATSRGTWYYCSALKSFPAIHFPNVLNASGAWGGCSSMTEFKATGFGLCTIFYSTWSGCSSLTSFPLIDTSSGTSFTFAWQNCSSLTSFPEIDTSSGTSFTYAWNNCSSLTSFPLLDTSSGTDFERAWFGCSSLTSFPAINFSSGTKFTSCWRDCTSLTSFSATNFTAITATNAFDSAFRNWASFTGAFPQLTTDSSHPFSAEYGWNANKMSSFGGLTDATSITKVRHAWENCNNLTAFPYMDFANCSDFSRSWKNCSSLVTFPANVFDNMNTPVSDCFVQTWDGCSSLTATSVENILNSIDTSGQSAPASVDITIDYNAGSGTPNITTAVTNLKSRGWTITLNGVAQ